MTYRDRDNGTDMRGSRYETAAKLFEEAIQLAQIVQASQKSWIPTFLNLGTAYRKLGYAHIVNDVLHKN